MSKKTLGIVIGVNGAVTTAAVTIVGLVAPDKAPVIQGIISAVSACVDGICLVFIKNGALPNGALPNGALPNGQETEVAK